MANSLVVSGKTNMTEHISDMLRCLCINEIITADNCNDARDMLAQRNFDIVVINSPLCDETGEQFARQIASKHSCQILLIVNIDNYEEVASEAQQHGIIVAPRPMKKSMLEFALRACIATQSRVAKLACENTKLTQKIDDIRIVNRAKRILVTHLRMSEDAAHKYIERGAMDNRKTRRAVAERIILLYENR